jgi:hypothetical protein
VNSEHAIGCRLTVVPMRGWRRAMLWEDTELPWVAPSPNMPTPDTARVYPGGCLVEGTNLSEGRGTTRPFEWVGAPFLDQHRYAEALERLGLPGVRFRPARFLPTFHKWAGRSCGACSCTSSIARASSPSSPAWRWSPSRAAARARLAPPAVQFERRRLPSILYGTDAIRLALGRASARAHRAAVERTSDAGSGALGLSSIADAAYLPNRLVKICDVAEGDGAVLLLPRGLGLRLCHLAGLLELLPVYGALDHGLPCPWPCPRALADLAVAVFLAPFSTEPVASLTFVSSAATAGVTGRRDRHDECERARS